MEWKNASKKIRIRLRVIPTWWNIFRELDVVECGEQYYRPVHERKACPLSDLLMSAPVEVTYS
jgi:hypothetical protein